MQLLDWKACIVTNTD